MKANVEALEMNMSNSNNERAEEWGAAGEYLKGGRDLGGCSASVEEFGLRTSAGNNFCVRKVGNKGVAVLEHDPFD